MWYDRMIKEALRKHHLNVDLHVHALEDPNTGVDAADELQTRHMKDLLGSAILRGLDVIGIVSHHSFRPGEICKQVIAQNQYDITALPGVETKTAEGLSLVVFSAKTVPQESELMERVCERAHAEGGVVMAIQPNRRNTKRINRHSGTPLAPDFVEIYNDVTQGGYLKAYIDTGLDPHFIQVINSAARNSNDLDKSEMMSRIPRKELVEKGIIDDQEGVDYVPPYLRNIDGGTQQWPTAPTQMSGGSFQGRL